MTSHIATGQLRRCQLFSTDALYRVVEVGEQLVECVVVRAPGLDAGTHVRFTRAAVAAMSTIAQ